MQTPPARTDWRAASACQRSKAGWRWQGRSASRVMRRARRDLLSCIGSACVTETPRMTPTRCNTAEANGVAGYGSADCTRPDRRALPTWARRFGATLAHLGVASTRRVPDRYTLSAFGGSNGRERFRALGIRSGDSFITARLLEWMRATACRAPLSLGRAELSRRPF